MLTLIKIVFFSSMMLPMPMPMPLRYIQTVGKVPKCKEVFLPMAFGSFVCRRLGWIFPDAFRSPGHNWRVYTACVEYLFAIRN